MSGWENFLAVSSLLRSWSVGNGNVVCRGERADCSFLFDNIVGGTHGEGSSLHVIKTESCRWPFSSERIVILQSPIDIQPFLFSVHLVDKSFRKGTETKINREGICRRDNPLDGWMKVWRIGEGFHGGCSCLAKLNRENGRCMSGVL